jgi:hypothetical protein
MFKKSYLFFSLLLLAIILTFPKTSQAEGVNSQEPTIETSKTTNGSSVKITFPNEYSGSVTTTFDGKEWKSYTKKYTKEDIKKINEQIEAQNKAWQEYFLAQQRFFENIWKNFAWY